MLLNKMRQRVAREESGFTLIELLIVLVIIGILLAIAVPSYIGFKARAEKTAAQSNVRGAVPALEAYYADNGDYLFTKLPTGAAAATPAAALAAIDSSITVGAGLVLASVTPGALTYTITSTKGNCTATKAGPAAAITLSAGC